MVRTERKRAFPVIMRVERLRGTLERKRLDHRANAEPGAELQRVLRVLGVAARPCLDRQPGSGSSRPPRRRAAPAGPRSAGSDRRARAPRSCPRWRGRWARWRATTFAPPSAARRFPASPFEESTNSCAPSCCASGRLVLATCDRHRAKAELATRTARRGGRGRRARGRRRCRRRARRNAGAH